MHSSTSTSAKKITEKELKSKIKELEKKLADSKPLESAEILLEIGESYGSLAKAKIIHPFEPAEKAAEAFSKAANIYYNSQSYNKQIRLLTKAKASLRLVHDSGHPKVMKVSDELDSARTHFANSSKGVKRSASNIHPVNKNLSDSSTAKKSGSGLSVGRKNSFNVFTRRKGCLPISVERKDSLILIILSIFKQVRDKLNGQGEYTAEAIRVLEQLISALQNNTPIIEREPLSPILREIPIESFTEVQDFLSLLRKLCCELEKQINKQLDYPKREKVLLLLDSLSRECTKLKRNSNKSSLTPSVTELVHPSSNIDTVPRDISRSSQSSLFAHDGLVDDDDVFVDGSLFFEQQDESACAPDYGHGSGRRSSFGSASDNLIICSAVYDILKKKNININLSGVDFAKAVVEVVQDEIKSQSQSESPLSKKIDNKPESRDRGSILEGLQEIKGKIEGYNVKNEKGNYSKGYKEHITEVTEKMGNLISAFMKEDWLTELLKRQQEEVIFQEDLKLLHLIEEWISIFKDHVGHASLTRALKPLTEIEHYFGSGTLSYEMSQGFEKKLRNVTTCYESIGLSHDSEKEQQDQSTSDFGYGMPEFCENEMFDYTFLRARQIELLSNPRDCGSFMPPFSPSLRRFDLPEDSMHAKKDLLTGSDTSASPSSKDISKRRMSLAVHNRSDDGKLLGFYFDTAVESCKRGDYSRAIEVFGEVFDRRKSVLGYGNYNTVMSRYNMAVVFFKQGRHKETLRIFLEMKNTLPKDSPYIESVKHNIDVLLSQEVIPSLMVHEKKREESLIQFDEDEIVNSSHRSSSASGRTEQEQISCPDSVTGDPNTSMDGVQQPEELETPSREGMGKWGK